jgi:TPR repeat protein
VWKGDQKVCVIRYGFVFKEGDSTCQSLHSTKVGNTPGMEAKETAEKVLDLNLRAANAGEGQACMKMGRAYLKTLPSALTRDLDQADLFFRKAVEASGDADGHFGVATILLTRLHEDGVIKNSKSFDDFAPTLALVFCHLEAAALADHPFATFNLGIAHLFGYGTASNPNLAGSCF